MGPLQIRHGAHLDAVDQDLNTPLHIAVRSETEFAQHLSKQNS